MSGRLGLLAGLRVLEQGDAVAGASATAILWSLGADVTTVVDPTSPHRRGRPAVGGVSLLARSLDRGKAVVEVGAGAAPDPADFDVVVVDRVVRAAEPVADYVQHVERHNPGAWVTISAFGLTGPRAGDVATELTVAAASGMLSAVRDPSTGRPLKLAGQQSLLNTGQAAALAACHALDLATDGGPVHQDVSAVEATLAMGPVLEIGALLLETGALGGAKRYGAPADFYRCTDGLVRVSAMEDHQWQGVVAALGSPDWADRFATVQARIDAADEVDAHVAAWTATRTKQEAETVLQAHGVPATAVYSPAEILASPQLAHREAFEPLDVEGGESRVVGLPVRVVAGGAGRPPDQRGEAADVGVARDAPVGSVAGGEPGDAGRDAIGEEEDAAAGGRRRSLRGLRVLEASRVLAVPLCGALLGSLGARVTKLEDLPRLDMYRRRGPYIEGEPGPERSAYFALMNHSKASAAFDADARPDRLAALVAASDVVIENLGRKRATTLGLAPEAVLPTHPGVLALCSSGFGQDGPHARYRAYAYNLQASCALGYLTRTEAGESAEIDIAWADLIAAYSLATIVAAWAVGPEGNAGVGLDFAMADLVVSHFNDALAAAALGLGDDEDRANELTPYRPNGVYPTADGWVALSVEDGDDDGFARLLDVLGCGPLDRVEPGPRLAAALAEATATFDRAEDLAAALRAVDVVAEACARPGDLVASPQLATRGLFAPVHHDDWGERRLIGVPWRPHGGPPLPLRPPPLLRPED